MTDRGNKKTEQVKLQRLYRNIVISLENAILPNKTLEMSPSAVDGLDAETESNLRIMGCQYIQTAGILLKIPQTSMATGQVLFQRFYYCKSFVRHPVEITAMSCIYLASKIEEAPRRIRDVINVFHHMKQMRYQKEFTPLILDQQYVNTKQMVIKTERRLLKELGFCVHVKHPHKLIVCYMQVLKLEKNTKAIQMAWNYINDCLRTDVFLRYTPETVACAAIVLTSRKLKIPLPKNPYWFTLFQVEESDVRVVCQKILDLYTREKIDPTVLEAKIEALKKIFENTRDKRINNLVSAGSENNTPTSTKSDEITKQSSPQSANSTASKVTKSSDDVIVIIENDDEDRRYYRHSKNASSSSKASRKRSHDTRNADDNDDDMDAVSLSPPSKVTSKDKKTAVGGLKQRSSHYHHHRHHHHRYYDDENDDNNDDDDRRHNHHHHHHHRHHRHRQYEENIDESKAEDVDRRRVRVVAKDEREIGSLKYKSSSSVTKEKRSKMDNENVIDLDEDRRHHHRSCSKLQNANKVPKKATSEKQDRGGYYDRHRSSSALHDDCNHRPPSSKKSRHHRYDDDDDDDDVIIL